MARSNTVKLRRPVRARTSGRSRVRWEAPVLAFALIATLFVLSELGVLDRLAGDVFDSVLDPVRVEPVEQGRAISARFGICSGGSDPTCVVDGDTFRLDGLRIRIADINTPEVSSPLCPAEAALGARASQRLTQLLNAGPFVLAPADRDEDQYGRKLRIVMRDGRSLGSTLVAEGLAHAWRGHKESWCA